MSETRKLVKCVFGLLLSIIVIVGGIYGFDYKVEVIDTNTPTTEGDATSTEEEDVSVTDDVTDVEEDVVEEDVTDEVVGTEQSPADSTQTEDDEPSVDESVEADVTEPTDEPENAVTEGEE